MEKNINYESCNYEACPHCKDGVCKNPNRYLTPGESTRIWDSYEKMLSYINEVDKESLYVNERDYLRASCDTLSRTYIHLVDFLNELYSLSDDCESDPIINRLEKSLIGLNPYIVSENDYCCYHGKMNEMILSIIEEIQNSYNFADMNLEYYKKINMYDDILNLIKSQAAELTEQLK